MPSRDDPFTRSSRFRLPSILGSRPKFDDPQQARAVEIIDIVVTALLAVAVVYIAIAFLVLQLGPSSLVPLPGAAALVLCAVLARRGHPRAGGVLLLATIWIYATGGTIVGGGMAAPGYSIYLLAILWASFVLGPRAGWVTTIVCVLSGAVVAAFDSMDLLPEPLRVYTAAGAWLTETTITFAAGVLIWLGLSRTQQALETAERSEQLHSLVANNSNDFIWSTGPDGRFLYASPAVQSILGFTPEELLAEHTSDELIEAGSASFEELRAMTLTAGDEGIRFEAQLSKKDGGAVWCEVSAKRTLDANGEPAGLSGVTRDISQRKLAEQEREVLEAQYRQAQKMEAVGRLAGGIAHDFNNYLTVILGYAEEMTLDADEAKRSAAVEIQDAALRSAELTQQLLAFSRRQVLQPVVLDLNGVIRGMDRLLRRVLGAPIAIETVCAGGLGRVRADKSQLEQIILNLALNARDAMPDGGKLTLETGNVYLDADYSKAHWNVSPGRYVMLALTDSGKGIDPETRSQIFEPFFTTKKSGGSGLGLATVDGIVKQSGGAIGVYSEAGEGTTFRIYLPRVDATDEQLVAHLGVDVAAAEAGTETVLVVEDEEMVLGLVRRLLEGRGYTVLEATNAEEALEAAAQHGASIDLLLTDIVLPDMSGVQLAQALHSRRALRVLYMSGFTENGIVHSGVLDPGVLLLQKPFTSKEFFRKVRQALTTDGAAPQS